MLIEIKHLEFLNDIVLNLIYSINRDTRVPRILALLDDTTLFFLSNFGAYIFHHSTFRTWTRLYSAGFPIMLQIRQWHLILCLWSLFPILTTFLYHISANYRTMGNGYLPDGFRIQDLLLCLVGRGSSGRIVVIGIRAYFWAVVYQTLIAQ